MYLLGVYFGIALLFALFVPMRDSKPLTKALGGFTWPLVVLVWIYTRLRYGDV